MVTGGVTRETPKGYTSESIDSFMFSLVQHGSAMFYSVYFQTWRFTAISKHKLLLRFLSLILGGSLDPFKTL